MNKLLLTLGILLISSSLKASPPSQAYTVTRTSFSGTAQSAALFSSHTIQFIGVHVSSATSTAGPSKLVIYRSTSATFTLDVATQVAIYTGFDSRLGGNQSIPLWDFTNSSYTYIEKIGTSETTIFFRCVGQTGVGNCPGVPYTGQR